jgi:hypothetical protein
VGFDTCDRFDLGNTPRNGLPTKYGTKTDLLHMMEIAHRFGLRVYFDNIMAHTGGFVPEGEPYELNDLGFVPADFHILRQEDGSYYKIDWPDWDNEWQVLHRNPFSWDIANDPGEWNNNFGTEEGQRIRKWVGVRHPDNPEFYLDTDLPIAITFEAGGATRTQTVLPFPTRNRSQTPATPTPGRIRRGGRRQRPLRLGGSRRQRPARSRRAQRTVRGHRPVSRSPRPPHRRLGLRRRQIQHGQPGPGTGQPDARPLHPLADRPDPRRRLPPRRHQARPRRILRDRRPRQGRSSEGYTGQIQLQHNLTHGFADWANHRDSVFVLDAPRNDAMLYGEHLNAPPAEGPYLDRGMRIANDWFLNSLKFNIADSLAHLDQRGYGIFNGEPFHVAHYVMSHDNHYLDAPDRKLAHAALLGRESLAIVYTDGYNEAGPEANFFPKPAQVPFLGQFGETWMLNLLDIRRMFGWDRQWARGSTRDLCAWSRGTAETADQTFMLFVMARRLAPRPQAYMGPASFPMAPCSTRIPPQANDRSWFENGRIRELHGSPVRIAPGDYAAFAWAAPGMPARPISANGPPSKSSRTASPSPPSWPPAPTAATAIPRSIPAACRTTTPKTTPITSRPPRDPAGKPHFPRPRRRFCGPHPHEAQRRHRSQRPTLARDSPQCRTGRPRQSARRSP